MNDWKQIVTEFDNGCVICGRLIPAGSTALWLKDLGIKHVECPPELEEDNSKLVIIDNDDKKLLGLD